VVPLRLFDPDRRPTSWTEIVQAGQYVAFSKTIDPGASCDIDGRPFASAEDATCLIFDRLEAARGFCEEQVVRVPRVRFEIFDSTGRANAPLLVIVIRREPPGSREIHMESAFVRARRSR
jgi:hypothetical protein